MTKADKYLMSGILIIALLSAAIVCRNYFLPQSGVVSSWACIEVQGKLVKRIELSGKGNKSSFKLQGEIGAATVVVDGKRICMLDAPCSDRICVRRGWIENTGESIVCIPNKINIFIESGDDLDAVTR